MIILLEILLMDNPLANVEFFYLLKIVIMKAKCRMDGLMVLDYLKTREKIIIIKDTGIFYNGFKYKGVL
jgi:hypothetical protein